MTLKTQMLPVMSVVAMQLWALAAALGAVVLGLVAYLVRRALGLVEPPPSEEETPH